MRIQPQDGLYCIACKNIVIFRGTFKECIAEARAIIKLSKIFKLIGVV